MSEWEETCFNCAHSLWTRAACIWARLSRFDINMLSRYNNTLSLLLLHRIHILYTHCRRSTCEPWAINIFQHLRHRNNELYDQCMAKKRKKKEKGFYLFFYHMSWHFVWHLYLVIILTYVCSRGMLQLFDKALIGFLLEICFKFILNGFMTVKHVCESKSQLKSKSQNCLKIPR